MYSAVDFVRSKFDLSYHEALAKIEKDVPLMGDAEKVGAVKTEVSFSFVASDIRESKHYWDRYKIPINIVAKYCFFAKTVYRDEIFFARSTNANPIFIYKAPSGNLKIYRPLSPDRSKKWGGNWNVRDVGGMFQLPQRGKLLIITSSIKDIMVLKQHGFNAICFNGEGYGTTDKSFSDISPFIKGLKQRFKYLVLFLDGDEAGRQYSLKLMSKLKCRSITLLSKQKDISDYQKTFGVRKTHKTLKKLLSKTFANEIQAY